MDERMDAPNGKRIVELLRKAAVGGYEGEKSRVMDNLAQLIGCYGAMDYRTIGKLADMVEEAIQREHESAYDAGYDEGFASADDWLAEHEHEMAEHGWVRLPKDADGEYIHVGDRMENNERVARIVLTDDSWEPSVYIEKLPNVLHEHFCNEIRHYHAPTVEDMLREMADRCYADEDEPRDRDAIVAEYAAKLRLVGDE